AQQGSGWSGYQPGPAYQQPGYTQPGWGGAAAASYWQQTEPDYRKGRSFLALFAGLLLVVAGVLALLSGAAFVAVGGLMDDVVFQGIDASIVDLITTSATIVGVALLIGGGAGHLRRARL